MTTEMREIFAGDYIEAGERYEVLGEHDNETRKCYAALTFRIPETTTRFFVED